MKLYLKFIITLSSLFIISCNQNNKSSNKNINTNNITTETTVKYINSINLPELELPTLVSMINKFQDSLFYNISTSENGETYYLYFKKNGIDSLKIFDSEGIIVYDEGDLDGDGLMEIGIINAYPTSACRMYNIYSIKHNKWKNIYSTLTHLPDRESGTDYFKLQEKLLRVISAKRDNCCQCQGLDTIYRRF